MIGVDLEKISRFRRLAVRPARIGKMLTERERAFWAAKECDAATLAGLWCAKEAVVKALGTGFGALSYRDVEIRHDAFGRPAAYVAALAAVFEISVSHTEDLCVAVAARTE